MKLVIILLAFAFCASAAPCIDMFQFANICTYIQNQRFGTTFTTIELCGYYVYLCIYIVYITIYNIPCMIRAFPGLLKILVETACDFFKLFGPIQNIDPMPF
jgi:hypothetical protein